jgi:hypothetical protein
MRLLRTLPKSALATAPAIATSPTTVSCLPAMLFMPPSDVIRLTVISPSPPDAFTVSAPLVPVPVMSIARSEIVPSTTAPPLPTFCERFAPVKRNVPVPPFSEIVAAVPSASVKVAWPAAPSPTCTSSVPTAAVKESLTVVPATSVAVMVTSALPVRPGP